MTNDCGQHELPSANWACHRNHNQQLPFLQNSNLVVGFSKRVDFICLEDVKWCEFAVFCNLLICMINQDGRTLYNSCRYLLSRKYVLLIFATDLPIHKNEYISINLDIYTYRIDTQIKVNQLGKHMHSFLCIGMYVHMNVNWVGSLTILTCYPLVSRIFTRSGELLNI